MSLFSRNEDLPGVVGVTRDCTPNGRGLRKLSRGDIAIIDAPDISRGLAQRLIDARPAAVINAAHFSTGAVPNFGPQLLLDAGVRLIDNVGTDIWAKLKEGRKGRLTDDGGLYYGERLIARGRELSMDEMDESFGESQQALVDHMEAFFGNTIQFIHSEAPLLIDGLGIPDTGVPIEGRKAVVVSPGRQHHEQLKRLKNFIREFNPVLIGVDSGADTLVEQGLQPELVVGNPESISAEALRSGARVVLPADPDGHARGLERLQDLGVGAVTFPAASNSATDLALLLADYHNASMIVNVGAPLDLDALFADAPQATPSALLSRLKAGTRLVDADTVTELYTVRSSGGMGWVWALLGLLVLLAIVIAIAGFSGNGSFTDNLIDTWNSFALSVQGLFKSGQ